ncbi:MAG TPA: TonB-dependent receptor plug domain-containing protein [Candidatus Cloacimonadota bacterium]|nr:TonB-dependent receptor plug domain-containing protein [Candidatus Cloacimonadota bacterium]HPS38110.1 TonB-dependent receptor plug domain-containing protein [Candidatus Cloacimonadota bacterium]
MKRHSSRGTRLKLTILALILFIAGGIQALVIHSRIEDESRKPIKDALITDGFTQARSLANGEFSLNLKGEALTISRLGYETIKLEANSIPEKIALVSIPIRFSTIRAMAKADPVIFSDSADLVSIRQDPDKHYNSVVQILDEDRSFYSPDLRLKGERNTVSLDGNLARHTLVMLDGIPQNTQGEPFDLSSIDPEQVDHLEYIKNNASVYGGSAAIGGILYIYTKKHDQGIGISAGSSLEMASYGYIKRAVRLGGATSRLSWRFSVSEYHTRNDFQYKQPNWWSGDSTLTREYNAKKAQTYDLSLGTRWGQNILSYSLSYEDFYRELPGPVNFLELYQGANLEGNSFRHSLGLERNFGEIGSSLTLWQSRDDTAYRNLTAPLQAFYSHNEQNMNTLGMKGSAEWNHRALVTALNLEYLHNDYSYKDLLVPSSGIDKTTGRFSCALKTGYDLELDPVTLTMNALGRYDHHSEDEALTWRGELKAVHDGLINFEGGASLGTSFALPSLYDLYWKGDTQAIGNPELKSERSRGWQAWLSGKYTMIAIDVNYSDNIIKDLIQWRQVMMNGTVWKPMNISSARISNLGLNLSLEPLSWMKLGSSLSLCSARDTSADGKEPRMMYTPVSQYAFSLEVDHGILWAKSGYSFIGERYTTPDNLIDPLPGYSLMNLEIGLKLGWKSISLAPSLNLNNLLNSDYQVYSYVPQPGRNWAVSLKIAYDTKAKR